MHLLFYCFKGVKTVYMGFHFLHVSPQTSLFPTIGAEARLSISKETLPLSPKGRNSPDNDR